MDTKPKVYFDTNALNFFCDKFKGRSKRSFRNYEILLSWPLVDEIECNSSFARTIDLAKFVWDVSNRKILLGIKDLTALEVDALLKGNTLSISDYFDSDQSYLDALREAKDGRTPNQTRIFLRAAISNQKKKILLWERQQRRKWSSKFEGSKMLPTEWQEFYPLLLQERYFNQILYGMVAAYGLSSRFTSEEIMNLDYKNLTCLSVGIEFYVALQFLIDSQSKKLGKPDRGDLPDIKHAFYVGISDYFVTNDPRVYHILHDLIDTKNAKIIRTEEFYKKLMSLNS